MNDIKQTIKENDFKEFSRHFANGNEGIEGVKRTEYNLRNPSVSIVFGGDITLTETDKIITDTNRFLVEQDMEADDYAIEIGICTFFGIPELEVAVTLPSATIELTPLTQYYLDNSHIQYEEGGNKGYIVFPKELLPPDTTPYQTGKLLPLDRRIIPISLEEVGAGTCLWVEQRDEEYYLQQAVSKGFKKERHKYQQLEEQQRAENPQTP